jgi:Domain of unknown function (DUF5667)
VRMGRPNQTHDRLDALLDGRPGEVTDDLAPLLAAAEALRADLADLELDPEVVDRHLEQALDRPATVVPLPVRNVGAGRSVLRRRLAAAGLAAALILVPATAASAASSEALPGQALYPVKLAVEQFRLAAVQWSPTREAQERAKIAAKRLDELDRLIKLEMYRQIPPAIRALTNAVVAANEAVREAVAEEGTDSELVAAASALDRVEVAQLGELQELTTIVHQLRPANQAAITAAVHQSQVVAATLPPVLPAPVTTLPSGPTGPPVTPEPQPEPQPEPEPAPGPPPATPPEPSVTTPPPPPVDPTTTTGPPASPTTTQPPGGTEGTPGAEDKPAGAGGEGSSPPTTLP